MALTNKYSTNRRSPNYLNLTLHFPRANYQWTIIISWKPLTEGENKPTLHIVENKLRYIGVGMPMQEPSRKCRRRSQLIMEINGQQKVLQRR